MKIHNVFVKKEMLYLIFILSIACIYYLYTINNTSGLLLFVVATALSFYATHNIGVSMLFGMAIAGAGYLIDPDPGLNSWCKKVSEGMEGMEETKDSEKKDKEDKGGKEDKEDPQINEFDTAMKNYNNVEQMLGGDAMKKMTQETMQLMEKQENLTNMVEKFGPMINKLEGMMGKLNSFQNGGIGKLMNKLSGGNSETKK